jgi:hypothetical protein
MILPPDLTYRQSDANALPSPPVLRGRGAGGEGVQSASQNLHPAAMDAVPLNPSPSPPSTGERGERSIGALSVNKR